MLTVSSRPYTLQEDPEEGTAECKGAYTYATSTICSI
jgi:hypothetical protein